MNNLQYNPYDFANPVNDPGSFAGRKSESDDVRYYLNQARYTRPIHLAVTGERSAGKTSMLNMIVHQAHILEFLVVRLDLNEGDSDPIQFFGRLFDSLLTAAVSDGKYGGFGGKTWKGYRSLVDADKEAGDLPLAFPAHWVAAQQGTRSLSEAVLLHDLVAISKEVGRKTVIVLDECDVLSQKKITLQILRNVFMNLDGYMLAIAGTPRLFPVFDDVFSPINRQFKKVSISPFVDEEETKACIAQPLGQLNLTPRKIFKAWPFVGDEIHQVTGGRPYEIQLLCHTMFRRIQDKLDPVMSLSLEVLDEVRMDLENRQGHDAERLSRRYRGLTDKHLMALGILRRVDDGDIDKAATAHAVAPHKDHAPMTETEFRRQIAELAELEIIHESEGKFTLSGDQFDEVYLRYLAASRGLRIAAWPVAAQYLVASELARAIKKISSRSPYIWSTEPADWFRSDLESQFPAGGEGAMEAPPVSTWQSLFIPLKRAQAAGHQHLRWATFETTVRTLAITSHFYVDEDVTAESFDELPSFIAFRERVEAADGTVVISIDELGIQGLPAVEELVGKDAESTRIVAEVYSGEGFELFLGGEYKLAFDAFCDSYRYTASPETATAAAFQALHLGEWEKAIEWADVADSCNLNNREVHQACLAAYDRALANLMLDNTEACLADLGRVQQNWTASLEENHSYLLQARTDEAGRWVLEDATDTLIDLSTALSKALST